jgi:hypothetical protein
MFDIDPSTSSSFDICNELWELMDWAVGGSRGRRNKGKGTSMNAFLQIAIGKKYPGTPVACVKSL